MTKRLIVIKAAVLAGLLFLPYWVAGESISERDLSLDSVLRYEHPANTWVEALPVGNGRLGAMVFGGIQQDRIQLNEDSLWSGEPRDWNNPDAINWLPRVRKAIFEGDYVKADQYSKKMQGPYTQSYMPLGDLYIEYDIPGEATNYCRELNLNTAITRTQFRVDGVSYTREVFASYPDQVVVILIRASQPGQLTLTAKFSSQLRHLLASPVNDQILLQGRCPIHVEPNYERSNNPIVYDERPDGKGMRFSACLQAIIKNGSIQSDSGMLKIHRADEVMMIVSAATSFNGYDKNPASEGADSKAAAYQHMEKAAAKTATELLSSHTEDYRKLFQRVTIDLGTSRAQQPTLNRIRDYEKASDPGLVALLFQYGRYLMIASSRPGSQPANLQGIWNDSTRPAWSSNWTMNINSQMNYWPVELCNLSECHEPMLQLISELAVNGRKTAQINYGCRGWVAHHNTDLWRQSAPVGRYGRGAPTWANFALGGVWHCMDLWEHYAFTQNRAYLETFAYPLMKEASLFCLDWLVPDGKGHLVTAPSVSCENQFRTPDGKTAMTSMASTQDMALIWDLFTNCMEAAAVLGIDSEHRDLLFQTRAQLYSYQIGKKGQLQEWFMDFNEPEPHHRHLSHLIGVFPGKQISPDEPPDLTEAVRKTLELRGDASTGWSMAWKVNLWARLKEGNHACEMLDYLLRLTGTQETNYSDGGGVYPNLFHAHPPFQIDANFGVTAGIAEMLIQSHRRTEEGGYILELLPALPDAWPRGFVRGLCVRGGAEVDISWEDGKLISVTVHQKAAVPYHLVYGQRQIPLSALPGSTTILDGGLKRKESPGAI